MGESAVQIGQVVVAGGFAVAFFFGLIAAKTNFCTMGALSDIVNMGHWGRMRMWMLAVAVAIVGTTLLAATGQVDLAKAIARRPVLPWLSLLVGGLAFGVGMTLSGGCANKNLIRLGGGSARSLVVLAFVAIAAYMTLKGLFGLWRTRWLDPVALNLDASRWTDLGLHSLLSQWLGLAPGMALWVAGGGAAGLLLVAALKDPRFRRNGAQVMGGVALGLLIVAGWYITGHLGYGENPDTLETVYFATNTRTLESMSFIAPLAYTLELLLLWTDSSLHLSFGIATVLGVVAGSAAYALVSKKFRWEGFASLTDLRNQLVGAVLMGFGGVTAVGCTVGQGMTGLSTLALSSMLAVAAIVAGSVATLRYMAWRAEQD